MLMPWTGTLMVCAPIAGRLVDKVGERRFVVGGLFLQAVGMAWLAITVDADTSYLEILPALVIGPVGITVAMPAAHKAVVGAVRPQQVGQASGVFMTLRVFGGVFGTSVSVAVFGGVGGYATAAEFSDGFAASMTAVAVLALVGMLVGLAMPRVPTG